jgi:hypothetical protein
MDVLEIHSQLDRSDHVRKLGGHLEWKRDKNPSLVVSLQLQQLELCRPWGEVWAEATVSGEDGQHNYLHPSLRREWEMNT